MQIEDYKVFLHVKTPLKYVTCKVILTCYKIKISICENMTFLEQQKSTSLTKVDT